MNKSSTLIIVRWDLGNKIKGSVVEVEGRAFASKIIFPERNYDVSCLTPTAWECSILRDTMPSDPHRGAIIVRPLRELTWAWTSIGPTLWGAREVAFRCVECPELDRHHGPPRDGAFFARGEQRNLPWRAAVEKQDLWTGSLWLSSGPKFWATFGAPTAARPGDAGQAVLVYPHGEKSVDARSLTSSWEYIHTGGIRQGEGTAIEAGFQFVQYPAIRFWDIVAHTYGGLGALMPLTGSKLDLLGDTSRQAVLALLRASAPTPEVLAQADWDSRVCVEDEHLRALWADLPLLHLSGAKIEEQLYGGTYYYPESDDGYRAAGNGEAWFHKYILVTGSGQGRFIIASHCQDKKLFDPEETRHKLIADCMARLRVIVSAQVPTFPANGDKIFGMSSIEWDYRYRASWDILTDAHLRGNAVQAAEALRNASVPPAVAVERPLERAAVEALPSPEDDDSANTRG